MYEGSLNGSKVCVKRLRVYSSGDPEMAKNVRFRLYFCPHVPDKRQTFFQEAVVWKRLEHPNIVPLLGVTVAPLQLVSVWMAGGELLEYIDTHPSIDRLSLVGFRNATLNGTPTPSPDFRRCPRSRLPPFLWHHPRGSQGGSSYFTVSLKHTDLCYSQAFLWTTQAMLV